MSNFKYEVKIYQKKSILKAQWYKIVTTHLGDSDFIYNQQVAQVIQIGSKMGTVMMLQTIKSATLMGVIVVDQTSIHNIAQNASAMQIWTVLLHRLWLATVSAMMKPILQGVAMMEEIAVEIVPIGIFVVNVHVMMEGHCHLIYHVSQGNI